MSTISQAYINAIPTDAAYRSVNSAMTSEQLSAQLSSRMTETQATFIAANFKVRTSVETPNTVNQLLGTGFDAVVWEGKDGTPYAGQVCVSMRGTQGLTDLADDAKFAISGEPQDQIVSSRFGISTAGNHPHIRVAA